MISHYRLSRPSETLLAGLRDAAGSHALTYPGEGGSLDGVHPDAFHWHESEVTVNAEWDTARAAIRQWAGHRGVGGLLAPRVPPLAKGSTMAFGVPVFGIWATGTCRIVRSFDDGRTFGFAYGTLPHHPEQGEEMFAVRNNDDGTVTFRIAAFSRPGDVVTRSIGPIGRVVQRAMTRRYLLGFADYTARSDAEAMR